jgi:predicted membrane protein
MEMHGSATPSRGSVVTPQLIIGLVLLVCGGALLLDNFGLLNAWYIIRLWPIGLILLGLAMFLQAQRTAGRASGAFWIFIGAWLLLGNLRVIRLAIWDLWPVPLVIAGGYLIWQAVQGRDRPPDAESEKTFSALAVMSGVGRKVSSPDFRGGEATALLGGCKIDLRDADIASGEAIVDVFAFWGGIEMLVPNGWAVVNRVLPVLGGADDHTRPPTAPNPRRLIIRGLCVMGGVEVKTA